MLDTERSNNQWRYCLFQIREAMEAEKPCTVRILNYRYSITLLLSIIDVSTLSMNGMFQQQS